MLALILKIIIAKSVAATITLNNIAMITVMINIIHSINVFIYNAIGINKINSNSMNIITILMIIIIIIIVLLLLLILFLL